METTEEFKVPPIPTPPVTVNAPVVRVVDAVDDEIFTLLKNVLFPENVCAIPDTKPVIPLPAIGIFKV